MTQHQIIWRDNDGKAVKPLMDCMPFLETLPRDGDVIRIFDEQLDNAEGESKGRVFVVAVKHVEHVYNKKFNSDRTTTHLVRIIVHVIYNKARDFHKNPFNVEKDL